VGRFDFHYRFEVGEREKHVVDLEWKQLWATFRITVDGTEVLEESHPFGLKNVRTYQATVGTAEVHTVVVEKTKALIYGGAKKQDFKIRLDGALLARL
jgi:hypothetical protein